MTQVRVTFDVTAPAAGFPLARASPSPAPAGTDVLSVGRPCVGTPGCHMTYVSSPRARGGVCRRLQPVLRRPSRLRSRAARLARTRHPGTFRQCDQDARFLRLPTGQSPLWLRSDYALSARKGQPRPTEIPVRPFRCLGEADRHGRPPGYCLASSSFLVLRKRQRSSLPCTTLAATPQSVRARSRWTLAVNGRRAHGTFSYETDPRRRPRRS